MFRRICAGHKVQLPACTADLARTGGFGAYLPVKVHSDTAIDGYEMIQLADGFRIVDITHGCGKNVHVMVKEGIQFPGAVADGEYTLAAVQQLLFSQWL